MALPEQRIRGVTVWFGGCMDASCDVSTIPHVVGSACAGAWALIVFVTLLEEQSVGAWSVGSPGSLSAIGANGLL
jgi:hypothetical protein